MKHETNLVTASAIIVALAAFFGPARAAGPGNDPGTNLAKLTVDLAKPGPAIGKSFYGLMTEEINHSYDGGLYAELIQNRTFQDSPDDAVHWSVINDGKSNGTISLDSSNSVNDSALKQSLKLNVTAIDNGGRVGVANDGFWGIPVWPNTKYRASFYARSGNGFAGPLTLTIEGNDGKSTFASAAVPAISGNWKKYEVELTTQQVPTSTANRLVISTTSKGSVWFSLVSLFPPTYKDRANGNRIDLMQKLADLHPAFLRFPGGNYLEGNSIAERFNWKSTIGPIELRPGHQSPWGYRSSDGLGLLEFLDWCEDLQMEPLLAVYAGFSLRQQFVKPGPDLEPFVNEALDEIEYCTGDASTKWGRQRAADGHPDPFVIHYVEIGNEDAYDRSNTYDGRFAQMFDAIKAKYPNLKCMSTTPVHSRQADLVDDHSYPAPRSMLRMVHRYDHRDPALPKVFFGEWATQDGKPTPSMRAALADAAWLTGLQQDAGSVLLNCYAPLFVEVNKGAWQWPTNLIGYDAASSFGSPSYYAQAMFSGNWGDTVLPVNLQLTPEPIAPVEAPHGGIGLATSRSKAAFKDIKIAFVDQSVAEPAVSTTSPGWTPADGAWAVQDGAIEQTDDKARDARDLVGDPAWKDYTLSLKAQQLSEGGGFQILFHVRDHENMLGLNVGGGGKVELRRITGNDHDPIGAPKKFSVDQSRWYDIRIETSGTNIKCYLDDKLVLQAKDVPATPLPAVYAAASRVTASGEVILKVVNVASTSQKIEIDVNSATSVAKEAELQTLAGQPDDVNSLESPQKVAPEKTLITDASTKFVHEFPPYSVSVLRLKAK